MQVVPGRKDLQRNLGIIEEVTNVFDYRLVMRNQGAIIPWRNKGLPDPAHENISISSTVTGGLDLL